MNKIKILVSFERNEMIFPKIELVENDYNHVEFFFEFDNDEVGAKVFELKKPNGKVFIKEIIDNKVVLSDVDEKGNIIPVINQAGIYEFEITKYTADSKFTINKTCHFVARDEVVNVDDDVVDKDVRLSILDDLINTTIELKESTERIGQQAEKQGNYAEEQGNYAKEQASKIINANNQATKLINNFETNVNEYTTSFNKNATTKQEEFDSNSTTKTNEYNNNATSKLKEYNDNHEVKLKDYNDNDIDKTKAFNANAETKTSTYDTNADDKLNAYNTNDTTKLKVYNDNATSKVSDYNSNATSKVEEYNSNATQKIAEYDEHSEELKKKVDKTKNDFDTLKNEVLDTGEASDTFIHVEDSTMSEMQELSVEGICKQVVTSGKNLYDGTTSSTDKRLSTSGTGVYTASGYSISNFIEIEPSTNYIVNTTYNSYLCLYDANKKFIVGMEFGKGKPSPSNYSNAEYIKFDFKTEDINNIQLEKGVTVTSYEKFTGGQASPNPDYPQEIKTITDSLKLTSCNKNLLNLTSPVKKITRVGLDITLDGNVIILNGAPERELWPDLIWGIENNTIVRNKCKYYFGKQLDDYTLSINILNGTATGGTIVLMGNDNASTIVSMHLNAGNQSKKIKINGVNRMYLSDLTNNLSFKNFSFEVMLERGTQATSFEEHLETQINANLGTEFIGKINDTYKDTLSVKYNEDDGQYHLILNKKVGKKVIDSRDNTLMKNTNYSTDDMLVVQVQENNLNTNIKNIKSNYFTFALETAIGTARGAYKFILMGLSAQDYLTVDSYKSWLSTHNVEVYYVLATPYEIDLGVVDMPLSYDDITNVFTDSDLLPKINAKYYRNFISTVRNLQINNDTLKNELVSIESRLTALENASTSVVNESEVQDDIQEQ